VIPTIGRLGLIERAIWSALSQEAHFVDYEIVVLDNCSDDGTWEYLESVAGPRIRIFRNADRLPQAQNWNAAVRLSSGEFVHILQDDNIVLPDMLATASSAIARYAGLDLIYSPAQYMDEEDRPVPGHTSIWRPEREELLRPPTGLMRFAREFTVAASFAVFSRAVFERHGGFDEESPTYPIILDIEFMLRCMANCDTLVLPRPLAMHRIWAGTRSSTEVWAPEMFTSMTHVVNRVFRVAADSGRLDAEGLDELRRALVQTFLVDIFELWAAARPHLAPPADVEDHGVESRVR
jgi:glycosyltransferase involved in cell wall biosynthesis